MGKLALYLPNGTVRDIALDKERIVIGRRVDNDLCLPYPAVSGEHAAVVTILADSFLEDMGSTNGTLVNGKPIVKHFLRDQDSIDIGRQRLVYLADDQDRAEPLAPEAMIRGMRELDEQVARVRALRKDSNSRSAPEPSSDDARGSPASVHPQGTSEAPIASRPLSPADDEVADDLDASTSQVSRSETTAPAADPVVSQGVVDSGLGIRGFVGFGERAKELEELIQARKHWMPQSRNGASAADSGEASASTPTNGHSGTPQTSDRRLLRVLSGPNAGREIMISKEVTLFGRVGLQVAALRRVGDHWQLMSVEGSEPPVLNGAPLPAHGATLRDGDTFTVANTSLTVADA